MPGLLEKLKSMEDMGGSSGSGEEESDDSSNRDAEAKELFSALQDGDGARAYSLFRAWMKDCMGEKSKKHQDSEESDEEEGGY